MEQASEKVMIGILVDDLIESGQWGEALKYIVNALDLSANGKAEILELIEGVRRDAYEGGRSGFHHGYHEWLSESATEKRSREFVAAAIRGEYE